MGESKFDKLADKIAKEYRKDGDSAEKAKEIGEATAAKIGFAKYGKRGMARKARAGMRAESFEAENKPTIYSWRVSKDNPWRIPEAHIAVECEGKRYAGTIQEWDEEGNQVRDAESFEADDYVIVDRGNYRVRVHKKNLDKHDKESMSKIHSEANQKGLMYDEETQNYISLNAESFEADEDFEEKYEGLLGEDGYIDYDGIKRCIEEREEMKELLSDAIPYIGTPDMDTTTEHAKGLVERINQWGAESFDAEKIEGQTQSNIYAKFFVGHVSKDELRGNGKFKTYDSAVKKAKEVAKKEGNSRVVSPMGAALWTSNDKGLFQAGHLTKEAKRFYNSEEEMATGYLSAESILYDAPMSAYDEHCIGMGRFCVSERLPGKNLCRNCDAEFGEMFPQDAEYTALGVPLRRIPAKDIMSPGVRAARVGLLGVLATVVILSASTQGSPHPKGA